MSGFGSGFNFTNASSAFTFNQMNAQQTPQLGFGASANQTTGFPPVSTNVPFGMPSSQTFSSSSSSSMSNSTFHGDNRPKPTSIFGIHTGPSNTNPSNNFVFGGNNTGMTNGTSSNGGTLGFGTSSSLVKSTNLTTAITIPFSPFSTGGGSVSMFSSAPSTSNTSTLFSLPSSNTMPTNVNTNPISSFGSVVSTPFSFGGSDGGASFHPMAASQPQRFSFGNTNPSSSYSQNNVQSTRSFNLSSSPPPEPMFANNSSKGLFGSTAPSFGPSTMNSASIFTAGVITGTELKEDDMMGISSTPQTYDVDIADATIIADQASTQHREEELARLKAKIEEKKRLFHEKKQRFEASVNTDMDVMGSTSSSSNNIASSSSASNFQIVQQANPFQAPIPRKLNPDAATYIPTQIKRNTDSNDDTTAGDRVDNNIKLNSNLQVVPSRSKPKFVNHNYENAFDEDLDDTDLRTISMSESLIGTCPYMCPEEEIIRRENEMDIQILEIPHPNIHPKGWTLRETAIKRFRRSAADFKLDIPALVRPPHVLERVCGYLEEWVMERDRQGVDQRYLQMGKGSVPPSLDVYQFIWDRTRMIRKDFILQNFVGTGGRCSATAVRVHERIARWHCMSEHQLSHLADFIPQSQQNIQELGQTMKTLNLYYDDALGRCTKEESDYEFHHHGCASTVVMGPCPIDYDGNALVNSPESAQLHQLSIGFKDKSLSGTSESEMRALYILLTANNDGGMEVIKYAGRLSVDRPDVFKSAPVKLAMEIFKAKKDYNYAKFFSLLRDPGTPYLFACVMFKYVEQMREVAFRMMSKTFGTRRKESLENTYDLYPLSELVSLLCFEDVEEAKEACSHYNIVVQLISNIETIIWKKSEFSKPRDPVKGTVLHLRPRKMIRTIESKLHGATRLAVCRGDLSWVCISPSSIHFDVSNPAQLRSSRQQLGAQPVLEEHKPSPALQHSFDGSITSKLDQGKLTLASIDSETNAGALAFTSFTYPSANIKEFTNAAPTVGPGRVVEDPKNHHTTMPSFSFGTVPAKSDTLMSSAPIFSFPAFNLAQPKKADTVTNAKGILLNEATRDVVGEISSSLCSVSSSSTTPQIFLPLSMKNDETGSFMNSSTFYSSPSLIGDTSNNVFSAPNPTFTFGSINAASAPVENKTGVTETAHTSIIDLGSGVLKDTTIMESMHALDRDRNTAATAYKSDGNAQSAKASASALNFFSGSTVLPGPEVTFGSGGLIVPSSEKMGTSISEFGAAKSVSTLKFTSSGTSEASTVSGYNKVDIAHMIQSSSPAFSHASDFALTSKAPVSGISNQDVATVAEPIIEVSTSRTALSSEVVQKQNQHEEIHLRGFNENDTCQRLATEEEKQRLIQEEVHKTSEVLWMKKVSTARKVFIMKKWLRVIDYRCWKKDEALSLQITLDPSSSRFPLSPILNRDQDEILTTRKQIASSEKCSLENLLYRMGTNKWLLDFEALFHRFQQGIVQDDRTVLCTIGFSVIGDPYISELMQIWIDSRVQSSYVLDGPCRLIVINCTNNIDMLDKCDAALFVIPAKQYRKRLIPTSFFQVLSETNNPRVILNFDDDEDDKVALDLSCLQGCAELRVTRSMFSECHLDQSLLHCFEFLIEELVCHPVSERFPRCIAKISLETFTLLVMSKVLWLSSYHDESVSSHIAHIQRILHHEYDLQILNYMKSAMFAFMNELDSLHSRLRSKSSNFEAWPFKEFLDATDGVPNYFRDRSSLPSSWLLSLNSTMIEGRMHEYLPSLFNPSSSLFNFFDDVMKTFNEASKQECIILLQKGQLYAACKRALNTTQSFVPSRTTIFLPVGEVSIIIDRVCNQLFPSTSLHTTNLLLDDTIDYSKEQVEEETYKLTAKSPSATKSVTTAYITEKEKSDKDNPNNSDDPPRLGPSENYPMINSSITQTNDFHVVPLISPSLRKDASRLSSKRHRTDRPTSAIESSDEVESSKAFTAHLKSLLNEESIFDMKIGNTYLSSIINGGGACR